jgi:hypothetical protein
MITAEDRMSRAWLVLLIAGIIAVFGTGFLVVWTVAILLQWI